MALKNQRSKENIYEMDIFLAGGGMCAGHQVIYLKYSRRQEGVGSCLVSRPATVCWIVDLVHDDKKQQQQQQQQKTRSRKRSGENEIHFNCLTRV